MARPLEKLLLLTNISADLTKQIEAGGPDYQVRHQRTVLNVINGHINRLSKETGLNVTYPFDAALPHGNFGLSDEVISTATDIGDRMINHIPAANRDEILYVLQQCCLGSLSAGDAQKKIFPLLPANSSARALAERAEAIIRTEVQRAQAAATQERMMGDRERIARIGWTLKKKWLSAPDNRVRPAHRDANGQIREIDEPFDVGGEKLMYPLDPAGSEENTLNCRCCATPVLESTSKGAK